jgi:hypothetical protein
VRDERPDLSRRPASYGWLQDDVAFVSYYTNIPMQDRGTSADDLFTDVRQRWAIETMYRDIEHTFLSDSDSPNGTVRHFYFQFSVLLYDMWRTARVLADADDEIT